MRTRRQDPEDRTFRQDAYASAPEFERGVLGNLVAARCGVISDRETTSVIWWLQQISWREGGLTAFAERFLREYAHLLGTRSMHKFGRAAGKIYSKEQVEKIRQELRVGRNGSAREMFPLRGQPTTHDLLALRVGRVAGEDCDGLTLEERRAEIYAQAEQYPETYAVEKFLDHCEMEAEQLAHELKRLMVDPSSSIASGLWNMPGLVGALTDFRARESATAAGRIVTTDVTRQIDEELDFAFEERAFVVIEGREGIGKSEAARNWCDRHPGRAVYVKLESSTDEAAFVRALARAVGTACSYTFKVCEIRARIQDALQPGHLMIVLDESHFLWPQVARLDRAPPKRVDWLRTALIDFGVPVALITTPQYFSSQCERFRKGGWNSNQIQRRITRTAVLPEQLSVEDISAVAKRYFPRLDGNTLKMVAAVALGSVGYLTTISHIRKRTDFLMRRAPGATELATVMAVLKDMGLALPGADDQVGPPQEHIKPRLRPSVEPRRTPAPALTGGRISKHQVAMV